MREQGVTTNRIEFAENIVEQKQRRRLLFQREQLRLRDFQGERDRPLLAFGCKLRRFFSLDQQFDVVPMRTDDGLTQTQLPRMRTGEVPREILGVPRRESKLEIFFDSADELMRFGSERRESFHQSRPYLAQLRAMLDERLIVGRELARTRLRGLQERVPRTQRSLISAQARPIKRIDLAAEKIKVAPAEFRSSAHELDVHVGERDHAD